MVRQEKPPHDAEWRAMSDVLLEAKTTDTTPDKIIENGGWNFLWGALWRCECWSNHQIADVHKDSCGCECHAHR